MMMIIMAMNVKKEKMDANKQSQWWWFDNHKTSNCSPWLESTLADLNEKTKTMLKIVEDDSDSFSQRAEMYYKKRPELISMVEDFYRSHRSLAERYDQFKSGRSVHVKSPLRNSLCPPKAEFDFTSSVKSFDSFSVVTYSSDECAESEVDDPEVEDDCQNDRAEEEKEKSFSGHGNYELIKLRAEIDRLREENEIQRNQIKDSCQQKEGLVIQLANSINELNKLRDEFKAIKEKNGPCDEKVPMVNCDLKLYDLDKNGQVKMTEVRMQHLGLESMKRRDLVKFQKDGEMIEVEKKYQKAKQELMKIEAESMHLKEALREKETLLEHEKEEKRKVIRLSEAAKLDMMKLGEEIQRKDQSLIDGLEEKDEEKRAVIRQLSLALEILREDNQFLKKAIVKDSCKKRNPSQLQMFKGVKFSKWFSSSPSRCNASTTDLQ